MQRTPEPELMTGAEQVQAYAQADFKEPNSLFSTWVLERVPDGKAACVDLGCGPGDIVTTRESVEAVERTYRRIAGDGIGFGAHRLEQRQVFGCVGKPTSTLTRSDAGTLHSQQEANAAQWKSRLLSGIVWRARGSGPPGRSSFDSTGNSAFQNRSATMCTTS